jgi:hypothetical protein
VLKALGTSEAVDARGLEDTVAKNLEPSPRAVRKVDEALLKALMDMRVKSAEQAHPSGLLGVLSRLEPQLPTRAAVRAVIKKFEEAFERAERAT